MIALPEQVKTIKKYPFSFAHLVIDVLGKPTDWREILVNLQVKEEFEKLASHVYNLGSRGKKQIVCPRPVHGTELTSSKELRVFSVSRDQVAIYRGKEADGAEISSGEVYALASADCLTITLHEPFVGPVVALHFSRESGVIGNILEHALARFSKEARKQLIATMTLGIHPDNFLHRWDHPTLGEKNEKLIKRVQSEFGEGAVSSNKRLGGLNLRYIAAKKLMRQGVSPSNIYVDQLDTYSDARYWSNRASSVPHSGKFGETGRNMVLVLNQ